MNTNDETIYSIPELGLTGTRQWIVSQLYAYHPDDIRESEIYRYDSLELYGVISLDYKHGDDIFATRLKAKTEKQSMCKKQQTIKELTAAATALIEKYNSVIQDREWVAMQAVARVNGFTYRGPWIAQEIQTLAAVVETTIAKEENQCNDRPTNPCSVADAESGI